MNLFIFLGTVLLVSNKIDSQRVAPGVPPQQYQQVPQQQYHQPPPPQYQQVPGQQQYQQPQQQVQYQQQPQVHQVPQQQFQQPEQHHQQVHPQQVHPQQAHPQQAHPQQAHPQQGGHQHGHHGQKQQILNAANIQHEREHIAEHMEVPIDTSKMSEQELQFHYFKMHDSDNNNKLDGCELIKSLIHWHEQGSKEHQPGKPPIEEKVFSDEELVALIDPILQMDDTSHDGFIDYPEFIKAQQKAAAQQQNKPAN